VTNEAPLEAMKHTASAISDGSAQRPNAGAARLDLDVTT
jgi:hypothetical protein